MLSGNMIRDVYTGSGFFSIPNPDPVFRGQKSIGSLDPGSGSATLMRIRKTTKNPVKTIL
jgi:hypothetical protein